MREILFRGKAANRIAGREYRTKYKNGDWVYGLLTDVENYAGFSEMTNTDGVSGIDVDKNTVGQYTGLTDKNGNKIFEGDIIDTPDRLIEVVWLNANSQFDLNFVKFAHDKRIINFRGIEMRNLHSYEIIGNIHDNPELLKGGAE